MEKCVKKQRRRGETIVDNRYGWLNVEYRRTEFWNKNTLRQQRNRGDVKKKMLELTENVNANTLDEGRATTELGVA